MYNLLRGALGIGLSTGLVSSAHAIELTWTSAPVLVNVPSQGGERRSQVLVQPVNLTSEQVVVFPPFAGKTPLAGFNATAQGNQTFQIKSQGTGNYHWLTANSADGKRFASSVYYFANPGAAPRHLLQQTFQPLEIKPIDLPREHNQYRANETWRFKANFQGNALGNTPIQFASSNGTQQNLMTDVNGLVAVTFPNDFQAQTPESEHAQHQTHAGHGRRQLAQFALSVTQGEQIAAFNYQYAPDAFTHKSVLPALGFALAGMLLASPLLWYRRKAA